MSERGKKFNSVYQSESVERTGSKSITNILLVGSRPQKIDCNLISTILASAIYIYSIHMKNKRT